MNNFFKNFKEYLKFPEMRTLWVFVLLVMFVLFVNFMFVQVFLWRILSFIALLSIGFLVFFNNLRTARFSLKLKLEKSRLDSIISSIGDGLLVYDLNFKILVFNKAAEEIFNLKQSEAIGEVITVEDLKNNKFKTLTQVIYPSLAPAVIKRTEKNIAHLQVMDISFDDPQLELRISSSRLVDESGKTFGFLKIIRDRTREIGLLKSKSDFITIAAHQLRTPLAAVGWVFETLRAENLNENQQDTVRIGTEASANLSKVVEDLLSVSKIEDGKFGYNFQNFDLIKFLASLLSQAEAIAKQYNVNVYFEPGEEKSLMVYGDPTKLSMAVSNLIDNAVKYNVPNGQVIVGLKKIKDKSCVEISIKDTGVGIPEQDLKKIFSKFFRASNVMTKETTGSGLGLYIARNIIKRHGGEMRIESKINRGTTSYFTLPTDPSLVPQKEIIYGE
ncbi:PAS domain-containing protein [Patescibacteria group bacterium]|nr:PAS domain-containing protein [Patescibacteria group bacterium]